MRIHISYVEGAYLRSYEKEYVPMVRAALQKEGREGGIALEEDPSRADVIMLWEGFEYKTRDYIQLLENNPLIRNHTDRVYTLNYEDHPEGLLAGLYTSLEPPFFNESFHRIWPFFLMNNPMVYELDGAEVLKPFKSQWLFSFIGATSHEVRKQLFSIYSRPSPAFHVQQINKWYNHGDAERRNFLNVALASTFCLCPHGYCSYTPRITEVMAMARVPVIIADDWIPFSFEESIPYYIKVPEKDIKHLPDILSQRQDEAEEIRRNARMLWEKYCSPKRRVVAAVESMAQLAIRSGKLMTLEDYRSRWHSKEFLKQCGWTATQQFALRLEQHARKWYPHAKLPGVSPLMRYRNAPAIQA